MKIHGNNKILAVEYRARCSPKIKFVVRKNFAKCSLIVKIILPAKNTSF